jgi:hypothetical protein
MASVELLSNTDAFNKSDVRIRSERLKDGYARVSIVRKNDDNAVVVSRTIRVGGRSPTEARIAVYGDSIIVAHLVFTDPDERSSVTFVLLACPTCGIVYLDDFDIPPCKRKGYVEPTITQEETELKIHGVVPEHSVIYKYRCGTCAGRSVKVVSAPLLGDCELAVDVITHPTFLTYTARMYQLPLRSMVKECEWNVRLNDPTGSARHAANVRGTLARLSVPGVFSSTPMSLVRACGKCKLLYVEYILPSNLVKDSACGVVLTPNGRIVCDVCELCTEK